MRILAIVAEASTARACLDAALAAAARLRGVRTIEALHVIVDLVHSVSTAEELSFEQLRELREGTAAERAEATRNVFATWMAGLRDDAPTVKWTEIVGAEEDVVIEAAGCADLLVLAKPRNAEGHHALHAAIFKCGRPLLLVPADWSAQALGRHIAIAWDGSPLAAKAAAGALPWITSNSSVTIILVDEPVARAADLIALLEPKGTAPSLRSVPRTGASLGDQLVDEAHEAGADLLVMGAYRHNEPLEWLLGGTTRHALRHADLPLLLAH